jgi:hypothetical protein
VGAAGLSEQARCRTVPLGHPSSFLWGSWMLAWATAVPGGAGRPGQADAWLDVLLPRSSAVEVAAAPPGVRLRPELALQLHEAPDPGAVGAEVGLDVGGRRTDGGQVDAEQLRAALQRCRDRPAQCWVVPGPHRARLSNTSSRVDRQRCVVQQGSAEPGWAALGPQLGGTRGTAKDSRG